VTTLMEKAKRLKEKIMGPEATLIIPEDAERENEEVEAEETEAETKAPEILDEAQAKKLVSSFGGQLDLPKNVGKYLHIDLKFADFSKPEQPPQQMKTEQIICGFCGATDNAYGVINEVGGTAFALQLSDLGSSMLYRLNYMKIRRRIDRKKVDQFEVFNEIKALRRIAEKKKQHYTTEVSGIAEFKCMACRREAGAITYSFFWELWSRLLIRMSLMTG